MLAPASLSWRKREHGEERPKSKEVLYNPKNMPTAKGVQYASDAELQRFLDEVIEGGPEFIRVRSADQKVCSCILHYKAMPYNKIFNFFSLCIIQI